MNEKFTQFIEYTKRKEDSRSGRKIAELADELKSAKQIIRGLKLANERLVQQLGSKQREVEEFRRQQQLLVFRLQKKLEFYIQKTEPACKNRTDSQGKTANQQLLQQQNRELKRILKELLPKPRILN